MYTISFIDGQLVAKYKLKYQPLHQMNYYPLLVILYQLNGNRMPTDKELDRNRYLIQERDGFALKSGKWLDKYCYNVGISLNWIRSMLKKDKLSLEDKRFFVFIYASYYKTKLCKLIQKVWNKPFNMVKVQLMDKVYKVNYDKVVQEIRDEVAYRPAKVGYHEALDVFSHYCLLFALQKKKYKTILKIHA